MKFFTVAEKFWSDCGRLLDFDRFRWLFFEQKRQLRRFRERRAKFRRLIVELKRLALCTCKFVDGFWGKILFGRKFGPQFFVKSEQALLMRLDSKGGDVPNIIWVHGYKVVANEIIEINRMLRKDLEYEILLNYWRLFYLSFY